MTGQLHYQWSFNKQTTCVYLKHSHSADSPIYPRACLIKRARTFTTVSHFHWMQERRCKVLDFADRCFTTEGKDNARGHSDERRNISVEDVPVVVQAKLRHDLALQMNRAWTWRTKVWLWAETPPNLQNQRWHVRANVAASFHVPSSLHWWECQIFWSTQVAVPVPVFQLLAKPQKTTRDGVWRGQRCTSWYHHDKIKKSVRNTSRLLLSRDRYREEWCNP